MLVSVSTICAEQQLHIVPDGTTLQECTAAGVGLVMFSIAVSVLLTFGIVPNLLRKGAALRCLEEQAVRGWCACRCCKCTFSTLQWSMRFFDVAMVDPLFDVAIVNALFRRAAPITQIMDTHATELVMVEEHTTPEDTPFHKPAPAHTAQHTSPLPPPPLLQPAQRLHSHVQPTGWLANVRAIPWKDLLPPSSIATILASVVGCIPLLKNALVNDTAPLGTLYQTIDLMAGATVPCMMLGLGATLVTSRGGALPTRVVVAVTGVRLVLLPALGMCVVGLLFVHRPRRVGDDVDARCDGSVAGRHAVSADVVVAADGSDSNHGADACGDGGVWGVRAGDVVVLGVHGRYSHHAVLDAVVLQAVGSECSMNT